MENRLDNHVSIYEGKNQYDFDNDIILNWYPNRIIEHTQGAESILELGLGHGFTAEIFSNHYKRHVIIEGSKAVINNFSNRFPNCKATIVEAFFEEFESDEKFDVIVMGFILEHVDNPLDILKRFKKYLNSNGKLIVSVPNAEALNRRLGYFAGLLDDYEALSENDAISGHQRYYTVSSLIKELENAGYEIEKMEGIYLKPFTTKQMMSLNFDRKILDALCFAGIEYPELSLGILAILK